MPEYQLQAEAESQELLAEAEATFATGEESNTISDVFTLGTLLFAASLVLCRDLRALRSSRPPRDFGGHFGGCLGGRRHRRRHAAADNRLSG